MTSGGAPACPMVVERLNSGNARASSGRGPSPRMGEGMLAAMAKVRWIVTLVVWAWAASGAQASEPVWEALRQPGSVVVLRHSYAPGSFDPPDARLDDCSTQRSLDDNGRAQARRV